MAIDFNNKILVTNPTTYTIGLGVFCVGIIAIIIGVITQFTEDLFIPASGWCALGIPTAIVGGIFMAYGLTKR